MVCWCSSTVTSIQGYAVGYVGPDLVLPHPTLTRSCKWRMSTLAPFLVGIMQSVCLSQQYPIEEERSYTMSGPYAANLTNHNPTVYSTNASFVYSAKYTQAVLALLDPKPGDRIVDLGCGTGEITRYIASVVGPEGSVVGVDSSESMVSPHSPPPSCHASCGARRRS